ncbi:hypothetical protein EUBDOL_01822 [Amedibacillus dolichus DSM 3991]|uniref:Uncharacterized protein n=1 Tax=Amedibacillus dolichus DSM 3991 TaxID=428127 RepID=A8REL2_9FIRM|nr:hypothetical protein EUBDOL_01822 [Amedibacillus dolichus DSM 3991]
MHDKMNISIYFKMLEKHRIYADNQKSDNFINAILCPFIQFLIVFFGLENRTYYFSLLF